MSSKKKKQSDYFEEYCSDLVDEDEEEIA